MESYNLGANSYIQKPVDFDQFRDMVKNTGLYWMVINQRPLANPVGAFLCAINERLASEVHKESMEGRQEVLRWRRQSDGGRLTAPPKRFSILACIA